MSVSEHLSITPAAYNMKTAVAASGLPKTRLYAEMRAGRLKSAKVGRRRLITHQQMQEFLALVLSEERAA